MRTLATVAWGVLIVGIVVAGLTTWRLSRGPIGLDFLTARLEALLTPSDGSARVDIGSTALEWDARDRELDVRVHDLRVLGPGGTPRAAIPLLSVGIAPGALLLGQVAPRTLVAIGPRIVITREADGRLEAGVGQSPDPAVTRLLAGALQGGAPRGGLGPLRTLAMRDAEILVDDRASGTTWHATNATLAARREVGGLAIERLAFDLAPASVVASGRTRGGATELDVTVTRLPTPVLERWWPAGVAPAVRRWVLANASGGGVTRARATLSGALGDGAAPRVTVDSVQGQVAFGGLAVRWRDGMPPLTAVGGTGSFSSAGWTLRVARGELEGVDVVRALVRPRADEAIDVDAVVRAPMSKALALLDRPGMRAAARFPFRPGQISGGVTARVRVQVPLAGGAAEVAAHGDLRSVSLRRAFRGRNVNAKRLHFALDDREFDMRGEISIGRAPLQLRWHDALSGADRGERVITVKGRLDAEGRQAFGADFESWLEGPVDVQARLVLKGDAATSMQVAVDLTPARVDLPLIALVKDAGAPGSSDARLALSNGQVIAVDEFRMRAGGTSVAGKALLGEGESWKSAEGTITMAPRADGEEASRMTIGLQPAGTNSQLTVTSDNAGTVFRAIDTYADARGGQVKLTGTIRLNVPGLPLRGTVTAQRFVLKRSPLVAKIAAFGGLGQLIDLLAADGVPFAQLSATFTQRAAVITLSEAVAASPGVAFTTRGSVDRAHDELSLDGTLVPNYTGLARLTQGLPRNEATLDGLDGERVQALDFSASGSLADPYVTARPATSIAPATLRDLLRLTETRVAPLRGAKRKGEAPDDALEEEPAEPRRKKGGSRAKPGARSRSERAPGAKTRTGSGAPSKPAAKPRVKRRAPAAPSAPDRGTE